MSKHTRSHPPTLLTIARRTIERECSLAKGDRVLVAVSGGRDSMALLHVMARLSKPLGVSVVAHGIDHGFRGAAKRELDIAAAFAEKLDVPFAVTSLGLTRGGNAQDRARRARYEALESAKRDVGAGVIATAHHADDRAETVLIRMLRGAPAAGLGVLPPRIGDLIRPLIRARRDDIDKHVDRHAIPFSDDPSNEDPHYLRTRVRADVLPLLRELNAGIVSHLCGIADDMVRASGSSSERGDRDGFPRAARDALRLLESSKSTRARVALPGGKTARYDREVGAILIEEPAKGPTGEPGGERRHSRRKSPTGSRRQFRD